jgi:hypothetical protein
MAKQENTADPAPLNIHQRLLAAMKEIGYIQKDGYNSFSKYKYVTHDAVAEHVRPALVNNGILAVSSIIEAVWPEGKETAKGKDNNVCRICMQTKFINTDKPDDFVEVQFWGEAADTGDKAIFKAISGVKKYILTNTFQLATGDDPETDSPQYKQPSGDSSPNTKDPRKAQGDVMRTILKDYAKIPGGVIAKDFEAQLGKPLDSAQPEELETCIYSVRDKAQQIKAMAQDFPNWKPDTRPMEMEPEALSTVWLELKTQRVKDNQ